MTDRRDGKLFAESDGHEETTKLPELPVPDDAVTLRVVHWVTGDRPCLVKCADGERNMVRIKKLATICGLSCKDARSTSRLPVETYCAACLAGSARGVLR